MKLTLAWKSIETRILKKTTIFKLMANDFFCLVSWTSRLTSVFFFALLVYWLSFSYFIYLLLPDRVSIMEGEKGGQAVAMSVATSFCRYGSSTDVFLNEINRPLIFRISYIFYFFKSPASKVSSGLLTATSCPAARGKSSFTLFIYLFQGGKTF